MLSTRLKSRRTWPAVVTRRSVPLLRMRANAARAIDTHCSRVNCNESKPQETG